MTEMSDVVFSTSEMTEIFSGRMLVQRMLDFEAALARAKARADIIPMHAAEAIAQKCDVDLFDLAAVYEGAAATGTPAVPVVGRLTELVDDEAKAFVHGGATSQDAIDTGVMLQMRDGLKALVDDLVTTGRSCRDLAERHRRTAMVGRTLLQHALPITFGLKAANWLSSITRQIDRLREVGAGLAVQFGGAAGTLAALRNDGVRVAELLAGDLDLVTPDLPWHAQRDRITEVAAALAVVAGAVGKIAEDVVLLAQTEVGEARVSGEGGVSSAMPHKRNPVGATLATASVKLALGAAHTVVSAAIQEHERSAGGWQSEWAALPDAFRFTASAVRRVRDATANLEVDEERMRANLDLTRGLIMAEALVVALAPHYGRDEAFRIVDQACRAATEQGRGLLAVAADDPRVRDALSSDELERVFDPLSYLGSTDSFIDAAIERFTSLEVGGAG